MTGKGESHAGDESVERTDGDVISVRISERKLRGASVGIDVWLFFQSANERARPWQSDVKVVDPKEQEQAVSRLGVRGACQGRMLVGSPLVETEQYRSIRVQDLPEVVVLRGRLLQAKQRLVPVEAPAYVSDADDRPRALHRSPYVLEMSAARPTGRPLNRSAADVL